MRSRGGGFAFLLLIVILIVGFGFYRGYLVLTSRPEPVTNNTEIKLIVDQNKIDADAKRAEEEVKKASRNIDLNPSS